MMFSEQVYRFRKEAKMTQEDLAEKYEVSRQAVAKWESGESIPDIYKIIQIARWFGVSLDELVCGEQQKENQREIAKKIYFLFVENMESLRKTIMEGGWSNAKLKKELNIAIRKSRIVFSRATVDELLLLLEDLGEWSGDILRKEKYRSVLGEYDASDRGLRDRYCLFYIQGRYDKIEEILKDCLDLL